MQKQISAEEYPLGAGLCGQKWEPKKEIKNWDQTNQFNILILASMLRIF